MSFVEHMFRHLENEEDEESETNQSLIRMKKLFWAHTVVVLEGMSICSDECRTLYAIVVRKCAEFYAKY